MATKRIRGWDEFVKEAETTYEENYRVKTMEFALSEDEVFTVNYPTLATMRAMDDAMRVGDFDTAAVELFGEELGNRLIELSAGLHVNPLISLVRETVEEFGLANIEALTEETAAEAGKDSPEPSTQSETERKRSTGSRKTSNTTSSDSE